MAETSLRTLLCILEEVRPAFTLPSFKSFLVLAVGWICTRGRHAVTQALLETSLAARRHHERFHRFFSRARWNPDEVGRLLFGLLLRLIPPGKPLVFSLDDTLCPKRGPHVFGIGCHLDASLSSSRFKVLRFGHVWVVLALVVHLPLMRRPCALPLLLRLYRSKADCKKRRHVYRTKSQLARQMLEVLRQWSAERRLYVALDGAYCNSTVMRALPENLVLFGVARPDACLTAAPAPRRKGQRGRARVRGQRLPSPKQLLARRSTAWKTLKLQLYGERRQVQVHAMQAQWYRTAGPRLLRLVLVRQPSGRRRFRVFFCTDARLPARLVLQIYALRWPLEVTFRDLKQMLGFGDSSARLRLAVERTAPFVGLLYTCLHAWAAMGGQHLARRLLPPRPWYRHKVHLGFADLLRAAQSLLQPLSGGSLAILFPRRRRMPRQKLSSPSRSPSGRRSLAST